MIRPDILFRRFRRFPILKAISIASLSASLACLLMVAAFAKHELSYDTFNPNPDRLYRLTVSSGEDLPDARCWGGWMGTLPSYIPEIERVTCVAPARHLSAQINNMLWPLNEAFIVDSTFFTTFGYKLISGDSATALASPTNVIVSKDFAKRYFGTIDVLNKTLQIKIDGNDEIKCYTIAGVMNDFPDNSHFSADLLFGIHKKMTNVMAYTYVLLKPGSSPKSAEQKIDSLYNSLLQSNPLAHSTLQLVTDIHLKSSKARELSRNGSFTQLIILASAIALLVIISLFNLSNNSRVVFLLSQDYYIMKRVNGASVGSMILEESLLALISGVTVTLVGFWATFYLGQLIGVDVFHRLTLVNIITIAGSFLLAMLVVMVFPIAKEFLKGYFIRSSLDAAIPIKSRLFRLKVLVVVQLCISTFVLVVAFGISRQMNYVLSQQLGGKESGILVIAHQNQNVIERLDLLKSELHKVPLVVDVCGVMEVPGDAIKDYSLYSIEGERKDNPEDIFCVSSEFFSFFKLKLLTGNYLPPCKYTFEDEINLLSEKLSNIKSKQKINIDTTAYSDHFVINKAALSVMGFKSAEEAIGKKLRLIHRSIDIIPGGTIVGVVDNFKYTSLFEKEAPTIMFERKLFQNTLLIRYDAKSRAEAIKAIGNVWKEVIPNAPFSYSTLSQVYDNRYYNEMQTRKLLSYFSLITLLVSALGLAVIMSFLVKYRLKEIGIRKVNGATTSDIFILLTRDVVLWVILGCAISFPAAWYVLHLWLQNFAMQAIMEWWLYALGGTSVLLVAFATALWQSWKAARMNPVEAIRYE